MAKNKVEEVAVVEVAPVPDRNYTLTYRRQHPGGGPAGRCSYGIAGVSGIVVFDMGMFADGIAPATITVDCPLALPKADGKADKAAIAAAKLQAKADKAAAKVLADQAKAEERAKKATAALDAAKAKLAAAATPAVPATV